MIRWTGVAVRTCTVSFTPFVRRSALSGGECAEAIYEAAALGVSALKDSGPVDAIAPGTEIEVREPATCHRLTVQPIRPWCDGDAVSPDDTLKKGRLKQLLA